VVTGSRVAMEATTACSAMSAAAPNGITNPYCIIGTLAPTPDTGPGYQVSQTVVSVGTVPPSLSGPLDNSIWAPSGTATGSAPKLVMTRTG